jgi:hypothetical protein
MDGGDGLRETIDDRREAMQQIATEKANPGGVVDLVTLTT